MKIWTKLLIGLSGFHVIGCKTNVTTNIENEVIITAPIYEKPEKSELESPPNNFNISNALPKSVTNTQTEPPSNNFNISNGLPKSVANTQTEPIDKQDSVENETLISVVNFTESNISPIVPDETTRYPGPESLQNTTEAASIDSTILTVTEDTFGRNLKNLSNSQREITDTIKSSDLKSDIDLSLKTSTNKPTTLNYSTSTRLTQSSTFAPSSIVNQVNPEVILLRQKIKDQENEKQILIENMNEQMQSKDEEIEKMAKRHQKGIDAIKMAMNEIIKGKDELIGQMEKTIRSKDETIKKTEESSKIQTEFEMFKLKQCQSTLSSLTAQHLLLETSPEKCNVDVTEFQQSMQDLNSNILMKIEEVQNMTSHMDECVCDDFLIESIQSSPSTPVFSAYVNSTENLLPSENDFSKTEKKIPLFKSSNANSTIGKSSFKSSNENSTIGESGKSKNNFTRVWIWVDWCSWYELKLDEDSVDVCQFGQGSNEFYSGPGAEVQDCSVFLAVGGVMGSLLVVASIMMCILALRLRKVTKQQKRRKLEEVMRDHRRRYGLEPGGGGVYRGEP